MARTKDGLIVPDKMGTLYVPEALSTKSFSSAFPKTINPSTGKEVTSNTPDWDKAFRIPEVQRGAENLKRMYSEAVRNPEMLEQGRSYYPRENRRLAQIGEQFNAIRSQRGMQTYFDDEPEVAGLLLAGGFSQNNSEKNRENLIRKTLATGEVAGHLSTKTTNKAIETGTHAMDVFANQAGGEGLKLYDYSGSIYHPGNWSGEWRGVKRGTGHTVDRHQHDIFMGEKYGEKGKRDISGASNARRYRTFQAGHLLAQYGPGGTEEMYGHGDSPDTFQAITWGPWRGGYT